ncbi:hypothetical protein H4582DRAFT_2060305 [Lactarius indigo]|nr:hypothetical protein H4582DRAFT_2060305 [Lactarius indigo]
MNYDDHYASPDSRLFRDGSSYWYHRIVSRAAGITSRRVGRRVAEHAVERTKCNSILSCQRWRQPLDFTPNNLGINSCAVVRLYGDSQATFLGSTNNHLDSVGSLFAIGTSSSVATEKRKRRSGEGVRMSPALMPRAVSGGTTATIGKALADYRKQIDVGIGQAIVF